MKIKNETEIQLMKILFKTSGKRPTKKITSPRAYPHGIERKYYRELESFFKPLTDYVENFINQNIEPLLRGDSEELHLDAIPGDTFRKMIYNLENWISVYMPDISELPADKNNNVILTTIAKTADEAMEFGNKEFAKMLDKGIHVNLPTSAPWWNDMKASWAEDNYNLITSNAKNYVSKINTLTEQAIVNGMSPGKLKEEIFKATQGLEKSHCKLLARDQMGKLNGQITQAQMQEIGLDMYVWSTAYDDRVRDSHAAMEGLLCRWDDASVVSYDGGKTWVDRPAAAVQLHPGQDIQCRCVGLAYYPELTAEIEGVPLEDVIQDLPPVQDLPEFQDSQFSNLPEYLRNNIEELKKDFKYDSSLVFNDAQNYLQSITEGNFVNPNYKAPSVSLIGKSKKEPKQYQYTQNCQRCVPTSYMRFLGFDVTAKPLPKKNPGYEDLMYNWTSFVKNKDGSPVKSVLISEVSTVKNNEDLFKNTVEYIKNQSKKNTFWECQGQWKNGGGHVFSAIYDIRKDEVTFFDSQKNKINVEKYLSQFKEKSFSLLRLDDKVIDLNYIKTACQNR